MVYSSIKRLEDYRNEMSIKRFAELELKYWQCTAFSEFKQ